MTTTDGRPDFTGMSNEQIADWFMNNDTSAFIRGAQRRTEPFVLVGPMPDVEPSNNLVRAAFRLRAEQVDWLTQAAGRDREGKSGIVRKALDEYVERHSDAA